MHKSLVLAVAVAVLSCFALAQEGQTPKAEVFGGYQYTRVDASGNGINLNGWNGSVTGNFNKWLGVTADFSGNYKSQSETISGTTSTAHFHAYTYTFGPVVSLNRGGKFTPFVHALFGGIHGSLSGSFTGLGSASASDSGFAMLLGGGADAKLTKSVAIRLVQADWMHYSLFGTSGNSNARISTGIVFGF